MSDMTLRAWVYTRGAARDYRWWLGVDTEPTFPGGKSKIISCVKGNASGTGAIVAYYDGAHATVALGSDSGRRDQHGRRVQQLIVVSEKVADDSANSRIRSIAAALCLSPMKDLVARLVDNQCSSEQFDEALARLISENAALFEMDESDQQPIGKDFLQSVREQTNMMCVDAGLSFPALWSLVVTSDNASVIPGLCIGAGIADPIPFLGIPAVISTAKPLPRWGATAGQWIVFATDGTRNLINPMNPGQLPPNSKPSKQVALSASAVKNQSMFGWMWAADWASRYGKHIKRH